MHQTENCLLKLDRMNKALRHQEPDRVPVSDFFWGGFLQRWREELGLSAGTDIYRYYDLDWQVVSPNMDPHIRPFEILNDDATEVTVRTGFGATIRKKFDQAMPAFLAFETSTIEEMASFQFDDAFDERRYLRQGDDQINGVGDGFARDIAPFVDRIAAIYEDFPVFGSVCEAHEMLWRIIGSENVMLWMGLYPDAIARFVERLHEFNLGLLRAQIQAAQGRLAGIVIWGDVAYKKGMLFSPAFWRQHFKPGVKAMIDECHSHGLPVIYHGCGNVSRIFEDFIEIGVDAYNPLEAKAGLDVVELRRRYGHGIGFCGNMDVQLWAAGSREALRAAVLTKLNAAKGGGFIFQSDHSVPSNVPGESYDYVVQLVRSHGVYPLRLDEFDLADVY
ncbi:uroporphyrinogen decarboxylase family protein [uncultured Paludibaculum sp.]|uniref:uroporphyrinogen decarboxylase family protein n=1 Tax=uncultured Paludibaculum sp. TaxID=1765020 RepID=UPI002AAC3C66|nr:uroporphyrinogen decarboxylase family protein [uncultured Paludibaculum sp.]